MVKAGDVVKVRVTEVDVPRKRIGLSMRSSAAAGNDAPPARDNRERDRRPSGPAKASPPPAKGGGNAAGQGALGAALMEALKRK